jgi:DNA-directed RNA polymerase subunit K/omega
MDNIKSNKLTIINKDDKNNKKKNKDEDEEEDQDEEEDNIDEDEIDEDEIDEDDNDDNDEDEDEEEDDEDEDDKGETINIIDVKPKNITILESENNIEKYKNQTKYNKIPHDKRISYNFLTKYEATRIMGTRLGQIKNNAQIAIEYDEDEDYKDIVKKEILLNKSPFIIRRYFHYRKLYEDWTLDELDKTSHSIELYNMKKKLELQGIKIPKINTF